MIEKEYIKLRRERDFGEAFNATFAFIKQEFNTLGKAILFFIEPVLLASYIIAALPKLGASPRRVFL